MLQMQSRNRKSGKRGRIPKEKGNRKNIGDSKMKNACRHFVHVQDKRARQRVADHAWPSPKWERRKHTDPEALSHVRNQNVHKGFIAFGEKIPTDKKDFFSISEFFETATTKFWFWKLIETAQNDLSSGTKTEFRSTSTSSILSQICFVRSTSWSCADTQDSNDKRRIHDDAVIRWPEKPEKRNKVMQGSLLQAKASNKIKMTFLSQCAAELSYCFCTKRDHLNFTHSVCCRDVQLFLWWKGVFRSRTHK